MKSLLLSAVMVIFGVASTGFAQNDQNPSTDQTKPEASKDSQESVPGGTFKKTPGGYSYSPDSIYVAPPEAPFGTPPISNSIIIPSPLNPLIPIVPPPAVQARERLPRSMQGTWYEETRNNTIFVYVLRDIDYDMYEVDPLTSQLILDQNGQPHRITGDPLVFSNNTLVLSPGPDQEGPFLITDAPQGFRASRILAPLSGEKARLISRKPPQPNNAPQPANQPQVKGFNVKVVSYTVGRQTGMFYQSGPKSWTESHPRGQGNFREIGRDEWSVYLQEVNSTTTVQLDLFRKRISADGKDAYKVDNAY